MDEKLRFVFEYEREEQAMKDLCAGFGISRETGYVWLRRYQQLGAIGLLELNRAPRSHPNQTEAAVEQAVLELRQAHMRCGPRKLKRILERDQPYRPWPSSASWTASATITTNFDPTRPSTCKHPPASKSTRRALTRPGCPRSNTPTSCRSAPSAARAISTGRTKISSSPTCSGESPSDCSPSATTSSTSTSTNGHWSASTPAAVNWSP